MTPTQNKSSVVAVILAVSEAIREAREIPSGTLYAVLCGRMTFESYQGVIRTLKNAGLVEERAHLLRWIGPEVGR